MTTTFVWTLNTSFEVWPCPSCGVQFAVTDDFADARRADARTIYCPNGHHMSYAKTEADKERAARKRAEDRATRLQADLDRAHAAAEHQAAVARGYKGALVQAKKRAAKGVCPVPGCKRHFVDVERHVASKHPDYVSEPTS